MRSYSSQRNLVKWEFIVNNSSLFVIGTLEKIIVYHGQSSSFGYFLVSKCCLWAFQVLMIPSLFLHLPHGLVTSKEASIG